MKRVLIWGMTANWGGIETIIYNYIANSDHSKIQFDFITTFNSIPRSSELQEMGCNVFFLPGRGDNFFAYRKQLADFMREHAAYYDTVWLNDTMFGNIDILKYAKRYGIQKRIVHAHNANRLGGGVSRLIRHKINILQLPLYATDFWACSQLAGEWTYNKKILTSKKYKVINNAIDSSLFKYNINERKKTRDALGIDNETIVLGHIGRFDYQKNHPYLLEVFSKYLLKHPNSLLICIGVGVDWEMIKYLAKKEGLTEKILFLGQRDDVKELLQAFDLFLLPSKFEGLPVVVVEALSAGLPCFISNTITREAAIIPELVDFLSITCDPSEWVEKIDTKMKSFFREDTQKRIVAAGYDIQDQANKLINLF